MIHIFADLIRFLVTINLGRQAINSERVSSREAIDFIIQILEDLEEQAEFFYMPPIGFERQRFRATFITDVRFLLKKKVF